MPSRFKKKERKKMGIQDSFLPCNGWYSSIDKNVIAFALEEQDTGRQLHVINCYNDPSLPTLRRLLQFLHPLLDL